jgi:DUF1680 family protein
MYITGGLGAARMNEGLTFAHDLPNETAYAETCASIALVFWAQRMFNIDPDSRYIDVMERALYNGILSGVSFDGGTFFYANPLASYPNVNPYERWSGITSDHYYRRSEWFHVACCPPNLARLVASVGGYFYSASADTLYVNLYNQNRARVALRGSTVQIEQQTDYPWGGGIEFTIQVDTPTEFELALRVPGWCRDFNVTVNGTLTTAPLVNGYARLKRTWNRGDTVLLSLSMPVERMVAHPHVRQDAGQVALQRGPVVYCLEEVDNGAHLANIALPRESRLSTSVDVSLFGGVGVVSGEVLRVEPATWGNGLYQAQASVEFNRSPFTFRAIPYCFWANRQPGEMQVWLRES